MPTEYLFAHMDMVAYIGGGISGGQRRCLTALPLPGMHGMGETATYTPARLAALLPNRLRLIQPRTMIACLVAKFTLFFLEHLNRHLPYPCRSPQLPAFCWLPCL